MMTAERVVFTEGGVKLFGDLKEEFDKEESMRRKLE
jgi:hypothetical protein